MLLLLLPNFAGSGGCRTVRIEGNCNRVRETSNIVLHGVGSFTDTVYIFKNRMAPLFGAFVAYPDVERSC